MSKTTIRTAPTRAQRRMVDRELDRVTAGDPAKKLAQTLRASGYPDATRSVARQHQPSTASRIASRTVRPQRRWTGQAHQSSRVTTVHTVSMGGRNSAAEKSQQSRGAAHKSLIMARASARRLPWKTAAAVAVLAHLMWGATLLMGLAGVSPIPVAAVGAGIVAAVALLSGGGAARRAPGWGTSVAVAALCGAGLVFWCAAAGPSWWWALAWLAATLACSARWWAAHPVGPGVPSLKPAAPQPVQPAPVQPVATTSVDATVTDWQRYNAGDKGAAPYSRLTNRQDGEFTVTFDLELQRGKQTYHDVLPHLDKLADGIGQPSKRVLMEGVPDAPASRARLTIITGDPVAEDRLFTAPHITVTRTRGTVEGIARYIDGAGDVSVTMWDSGGMVPTSIIGQTGGGKSAVANLATVGAMSTGVMNLLYIDPKGQSSAALARAARVAVLGPDAAAQAPRIANAIMEARRAYSIAHGLDKLRPTPEMPGWEILHDEFSELINRGYKQSAMAWCSIANTARSFALWTVALSQAMHETKWGDDQTRSAFATQMIIMRMRTRSDKLMPGIEYPPHELPARKGSALYVYDNADRSNVPIQCDFLPSDSDDELDVEPPYRTGTAFSEFFAQPELHPVDYDALVALLGEPVNGQWVVGPGGTHQFPTEGKPAAGSVGPRPKPTGFGLTASDKDDEQNSTEEELTSAQQSVLALIEGGTTRRGDIEAAATVGRTAVNYALDELSSRGLVRREGRGVYVSTCDPQ